MRRASRSVTANLAEGFGRYHHKENYRFGSNARGSCTEVLDHLITAHDESLISTELLTAGRLRVLKAHQLISGYMRYLRRAAQD